MAVSVSQFSLQRRVAQIGTPRDDDDDDDVDEVRSARWSSASSVWVRAPPLDGDDDDDNDVSMVFGPVVCDPNPILCRGSGAASECDSEVPKCQGA
ncbi:hypothetical protein AND_005729 [Anopheles darlingi]|uniref:Uncharacterized protein n=1 Tax=Anopheles darlingi TaxID=43151 RepID=W5JDZ4_ANODA|nr:hypothetical protein AND_005729 [Anopheles darlingi]